MSINAKIPEGPLAYKWTHFKNHAKIISPANKRKFKIIIVGSGLAGASAAATLGEQGYNIECFCYQDSPRRAHSIAAQGGINAAIIEHKRTRASFNVNVVPWKRRRKCG